MAQIQQLTLQVSTLTASIRSLEETLLQKKGSIRSLASKNRGLGKLTSNKSEKVIPAPPCNESTPQEEAPKVEFKEWGNNNAKRKEFFDMETIIEEVYPDHPGFDKEKSRVIARVKQFQNFCLTDRGIGTIGSNGKVVDN